MSHLSQYAKTFKDIQIPQYQQQQPFQDDSENASVGSLDNLDPIHHQHNNAKHRPRRVQEWPWKKYLPEQYAIPSKELCERDDPDHHCEFCGPPAPTNAVYLSAYHAPLPSLLE